MRHTGNNLWKLLALKLSNEATPDDLAELDNYLDVHPEEKKISVIIEAYWKQTNEPVDISDEIEEERFHLILNAEDKEEPANDEKEKNPAIKALKKNNYKWFYAAASVILILGIFFLFNQHSINDSHLSSQTNIQQVFVKPGSKSKIILPDGTVVRLNGSSTLSYNKDFNKSIREVKLDGEAYFDVTKDARHPFIVHTSKLDIKVLGTLFDVKSYQEDPTIEATLLRGSIEVYNKDDPSAPKVFLKPNEKLVFRKKDDLKIPEHNKADLNSLKKIIPDENISISTLSANKPDSLKTEISWLYDKLVIDGDNFTEMAQKMERWYGVKIEILSPALEQYHFNGIFKNETVEEALDALQLTVKFKYKIKNDVVELRE